MRFFYVVVFFGVTLFADPSWYHKLSPLKTNSYVGYGSGVDESHAKQEALNDITSQISVCIDTSMTQKQKLVGGEFKTSEEFIGSQKSNAVLYDYLLRKSEFNDGKYFVAVEYENIPSLDKFVHKIKNHYSLQSLKNEKQNTYLKHTLIAKDLQKSLGVKIDFSLLRKDKKWYIQYKDILQTLDFKDFAKFFTTVSANNLEINTNKRNNILYNNDFFYFKVKSSKAGYLSILTVYEDGTVSTLMRNIRVKGKTLTHLPDKEFESIPQAALMKRGVETYDLYVLLYSKKRIVFDSFAYADEELIDEEKYKNFDALIEFINGKEYVTLKVVTKPKM